MKIFLIMPMLLFCFIGCDTSSNSSEGDKNISNTASGATCVVDGVTYNAGDTIPSGEAFTFCRCKEDGTSICDISSPVEESN